MVLLKKPKRLYKGDTIATISISGGRAGDDAYIGRYKIGKARLEDIYELKVVETPNSLKGSDYLYKNPKARADDLLWALENKNVKAIIANMGGDDSVRLLPYIDTNVIKKTPKYLLDIRI